MTTHAELREQTSRAYAQLLLHVHDPWTDYCFRCDQPGPCDLQQHWLTQLQTLEDADYDLHETEEAALNTQPTPEPEAQT